MADILWPSSLPQDVLLDGYGESPQMPKVSVQTDNSIPIERPKTTLRVTKIQCNMDMTDVQLERFEDFIFTELQQGSQQFYITHPRKRSQVRVQIVGDEPYTFSKMAPGYWKVSMTLTVFG